VRSVRSARSTVHQLSRSQSLTFPGMSIAKESVISTSVSHRRAQRIQDYQPLARQLLTALPTASPALPVASSSSSIRSDTPCAMSSVISQRGHQPTSVHPSTSPSLVFTQSFSPASSPAANPAASLVFSPAASSPSFYFPPHSAHTVNASFPLLEHY
jgi:hypothetical protein